MNIESIFNSNAELYTYENSDDKVPYPTLTFRLNNASSGLKHRSFDPYEPHVWQEYDSSGSLWWCGYAPQAQQSVCCSTEAELQSWLNQLSH